MSLKSGGPWWADAHKTRSRYAPGMRQPMKRYAPISGTESTAHLSQTGYGNYLVIGWVDIDAELLTPCKRNKK